MEMNDVIEDVKVLLRYVAGKQATTADEFHRLTACEHDEAMLRRLADESAELLAGTPGDASYRHALVRSVVARWLEIAGFAGAGSWLAACERELAMLHERRPFGPLRRRSLPPF